MTNAVLAKLRSFVTGLPVAECELCARALAGEQEQLLEPDARRVLRACLACAQLLAEGHRQLGARYLRVQRRAARLPQVFFDDAVWAELSVPVGLAFFTTRGRTGEVVATFPGRAGLIETYVPLKAWSDLERSFPVLKGIAPEVEALLVRRTLRHQDYFQVSIDHCYELSGLLRSAEAPFSSPELGAVQTFFERLEQVASSKAPSKSPGA
jgi:hypothetical protein